MIGHKKLKALFKKLADERKLQNSIFFGEEKIGKKNFALSLANYLERGVFENASPVLSDLILIDGGNNLGVDIARQIKGFLSEKPFFSSYRLVIIDDAQNLTAEAQNALLKFAEDSPVSSRIILITRNFELLLPTLASRFQKFYFGNLSNSEMAEFLKSRFSLAEEKAEELIKKSFGRPGFAVELLGGKNDACSGLIGAPPARRKAIIKELIDDENFDLKIFLDNLIIGLSVNTKKNYSLIKKALKLRKQSELNLNPRLQLENLFF
ncbi:hypothetical protein M1513_00915 [Patescibacteria group bacterium]|nr:hypothetical protein [Patescibacteria group bacterium]